MNGFDRLSNFLIGFKIFSELKMTLNLSENPWGSDIEL
jgi:hypothetical protein